MGRWWDRESQEASRQQAAEHFRKAKEGWQQFTEGLKTEGELEEQWNLTLNHLLANPDAIDAIPEGKLEAHLIEAEGRVEHLKTKVSRFSQQDTTLGGFLPGQYASLLNSITSMGTNMLDEEIRRHEQLVRLIHARKRREAKALPEESVVDKAAKKMADEIRTMNEIVTRLESDCENAVRQNPRQEEAIRRRYRKAIDAVLDKT